MPSRDEDVPGLATDVVARELGVSPALVETWCRQGLLPCDVLPSGQLRVSASALDAFRAGQARWQGVDDAVKAASGNTSAPEEQEIFREIAARRALGPEITVDMLGPEGDRIAAEKTVERLMKKGMTREDALRVVGLK